MYLGGPGGGCDTDLRPPPPLGMATTQDGGLGLGLGDLEILEVDLIFPLWRLLPAEDPVVLSRLSKIMVLRLLMPASLTDEPLMPPWNSSSSSLLGIILIFVTDASSSLS